WVLVLVSFLAYQLLFFALALIIHEKIKKYTTSFKKNMRHAVGGGGRISMYASAPKTAFLTWQANTNKIAATTATTNNTPTECVVFVVSAVLPCPLQQMACCWKI